MDSRSILLLLLVDLEVNEAKIEIFITNIYAFPGFQIQMVKAEFLLEI